MKAYITVDLGFGDSGKGTITDALVRRYDAELVVRFNGGCQAGHNVYDPDGRHHCFSQLGSGTFVPKTYTFLSQFMLVNPLLLVQEAESMLLHGVTDALNRVFIDNRCIVITPYHRAINRLREITRGGNKHGSCGMGIGECMSDALQNPDATLHIGDFHNVGAFAGKMMACRERMTKLANSLPGLPGSAEVEKQLSTFSYDIDKLFDKYRQFYLSVGARCITDYQATSLLSSTKTAVFEAAQGVLLDENYGFHPYTTWSTTTMRNAKLLLEEAEITDKPTTIGIIRSYMTRHGAGPFPTEDQEMTRVLADPNNKRNPWQDSIRCGPLDLPLLDYALACNGPVDCLAVTHMDAVKDQWPVCFNYSHCGGLLPPKGQEQQEQLCEFLNTAKPMIAHTSKTAFLPLLEQTFKTPVGITSHGPGAYDKLFHSVLSDAHKD